MYINHRNTFPWNK